MRPKTPTIIINARGETVRVIQPRDETRKPMGFQPPKRKGAS